MNEKAEGKKQAAVKDENVGAKHPLLEFVPAIFNSFEEWLAKWNTATYLAEKLGLLHYFTLEKCWLDDERLVTLLLEVADGCDDYGNFRVDGESSGYGYDNTHMIDNAKKRQSIAEKAFNVLCLKFFRDGKGGSEKPLWWWMLGKETLFKKVLWFLRVEENCHHLHNRWLIGTKDSNDHQKEVFRVFAHNFARLGWKFHSMSERHCDEKTDKLVKERLTASRPQLIDILCELGELNWLNGQELDTASLKKLTKLALDQDLDLPRTKVYDGSSSSYRKPISLEEAVLGESVAARIVLLHRVREKERKRIGALYEKSKRQQQNEQRQRQLGEIEAQKKRLERKAKDLAKA